MKPTQSHTDLDAIRARLDRKEGPEFWRSLEQLADTGEFQTFMEKEFPQLMPAKIIFLVHHRLPCT